MNWRYALLAAALAALLIGLAVIFWTGGFRCQPGEGGIRVGNVRVQGC